MEIRISSKHKLFDLRIKELFHYKDLIYLFAKKNYATRYKQTIFGSAWIVITPLLSILFYSIIFKNIAGLSTDSVPGFLFYLSGTVIWNFFYSCVSGNSNIFVLNTNLFSKIYFPRLSIPLATILTSLLDFVIQIILLVVFVLFYYFKGYSFHFTNALFLIPVVILELALFGLSLGLLFSSLNVKYRDLNLLLHFLMQISGRYRHGRSQRRIVLPHPPPLNPNNHINHIKRGPQAAVLFFV